MNQDASLASASCYDNQILADFHSGKLSGSGLAARISSHLQICLDCRSRLTDLESGPGRTPTDPDSPGRNPVEIIDSRSTRSRLNTSDAEALTRTYIPRDEPLPPKIDRYFVISRLGSGGFGEVFLAKDPDHDRLVAIKIPRADRLPSEEARAAFLKEARTVARFDHPHIVPVYDYRELEDGRCIVVMKYIEGQSLRQIIRAGGLQRRQAAKLIADVADALDYAHRRSVWHRDVKPANILVDEGGRPFLTDFGLAVHQDQQHLHENELAGTYQYMSPEQLRAESASLDGRSDIWSLGVVFYELLTGQRPFLGKTLDDLSSAILQQPVPHLKSRNRKIPRTVARICRRCLAKEASDRYATAGRLSADLKKYLRRRAIYAGAAILALSLVLIRWGSSHAEIERNDFAPENQIKNANDAAEKVAAGQADAAPKPTMKRLAWPTIQKGDKHKTDAQGRFTVKSTAVFACFDAYAAPANSYTVGTEFQLLVSPATAGLVLGIERAAKDEEEYRCMLVYAGQLHPLEGTWLTIETGVIRENSLGKFAFFGEKRLARQQVDEEPLDFIKLAVDVADEEVRELRFQDAAVPLKTNAPLRIPRHSRTGVVARWHCVFHSITTEEIPP